MTRQLTALAAFLFAVAPAAAADDISSFPGVDQLPEGYKQEGGHVNLLGIPYMSGDPTKLPTTVYWVHDGKIIGFEVVIDEKQIKDHIDVMQLQPMAGLPPINHMELDHDFGHGHGSTTPGRSVWSSSATTTANGCSDETARRNRRRSPCPEA